ncbi:MAG: hypothetical protein GY724_17420 [Actinomycetia bacterium]|nr:hypothetical protein [Actinomycetes bacterium]MCP5031903.1 hypothetical protein [Actinomycetes bacterium]
MTLHLTIPEANQAQRHYIIDVLVGRWLGLDHVVEVEPGAMLTTMTLGHEPGELRLVDGLLGHPLDEAGPQRVTSDDGWVDPGPVMVTASGGGRAEVSKRLPVLYGEIPAAATRTIDEGVSIEIDLLGTSFAMLSGLEDRFITERDAHDRVPMTSTLVHRRGLVGHPVVDELVELLWAAMASLWPRLTRQHRQGTIRVTQDVDRVGRFGRASLTDLALSTVAGLRRGGLGESVRSLGAGLRVRAAGRSHDPCYTFSSFMDQVEGHGYRADFYFICRYDGQDGTRLGNYQIDDPFVGELLSEIHRRGHELGVHPSYRSHLDVAGLEADAAALTRAAAGVGIELGPLGGRHHYLRWDSHRSPGCWQAAGLVHDSSVGFAEAFGFRAGTSKPFPLWDHQRQVATEVEERPLLYMDTTLATLGLGFGQSATADQLLILRDRCIHYGGDFTVLVHNDNFALPGADDLLSALLS